MGRPVRAYFLSDLHLGAPYFEDTHERERRVVAFLDSIKQDATHLYLLGDVLDYWYEYRNVVPRGYVRFFGKIAELTDNGVKVTWLIGNHDIWIFDYIPNELGVRVADGVVTEKIGNHTFLLSHGDGVGNIPAPFRYLRRLFRNRVCQRLFSAIHPRWTVPFAYAWSRHSRATGLPPSENENPLEQNLEEFSREWHSVHPDTDYFVYGHLHIVVRKSLLPGVEMIVLGDWIWHMSYGVYDGETFEMRKWVD